jgi:hypothetical protein
MELIDCDTDYEKKINKILNKIQEKDIRTMKDIKNETTRILDKLYGPYYMYKNNEVNRENAEDLLEGYEYVESIDFINKRDYIIMVTGDQFFDIKARYLGTFFKFNIHTNKLCIRDRSNRFYDYLPDRAFFRKINTNDKLKIALVEAIDMIK